jgi:hypothetical protein
VGVKFRLLLAFIHVTTGIDMQVGDGDTWQFGQLTVRLSERAYLTRLVTPGDTSHAGSQMPRHSFQV